MKIKATKLRTLAAVSLVAVAALTGCSSPDSAKTEAGSITLRVGTTDAARSAWQLFVDKAKEEGINVETVSFSSYNLPNQALAEGQIDVNLFQHLKFLAEYNVGNNQHLVPVGSTEIVPLALFWKDHTSLDGIEGQSVVIPNDSSNQGRAINVLVQAGLVTLKDPNLTSPTPADIDPAASKVTVTPVEAAQSPNAYGEGKPTIINNTWLSRANIDPKSAVFQDDPNSPLAEPYINAFVTTEEKKDDENIQKLVKIFQSDEVTAAVAKDSNGTSVPVKRPAADLQEILDRLEAQLKENPSN